MFVQLTLKPKEKQLALSSIQGLVGCIAYKNLLIALIQHDYNGRIFTQQQALSALNTYLAEIRMPGEQQHMVNQWLDVLASCSYFEEKSKVSICLSRCECYD